MEYTFRGQLCGYVCPEIKEPIADATVRLYRVDRDVAHVTERATAAAKGTFEILDRDAVEAKADRLLVETRTDDDGAFEVHVGDGQEYDGEAFGIDVRTDHVPGPQDEDADPIRFTLTTHQPKWREGEEGAVSFWEHCVSERWWCRVRELFGAWVICGRVMDCEESEQGEGVPTGPAVGDEVTAYDTDITQRDELGRDTTDTDGYFRIYYSRSDFERTPTPWLPIELIGGPDVHVEIRDPSGSPVLVEDRSRGRDSDRENVGPCFHIGRFCVEVPEDGDGPPVVEPMWTHVGEFDIVSRISAAGYAQEGGDDLAFTGTLPLIGALPYGGLGDPHEYRFRIAEYAGTGTTGSYTNPDASMIAPTRIGTLQYWSEPSPGTWKLQHEPYWLNNPGAPNAVEVDTDGWIQVPRENDKGSPGGPAGTGLLVRNSDLLARFRSEQVLDEVFDLTTAPEHVAGQSLDPSERSSEHVYELVFETRETDPITGAPVSGTFRRDVLSKIVLSNTSYEQHRHPSWNGHATTKRGVVMLDVSEFRSGSGCQRLSDTMDVMVSAYHPHIDDASLRLVGGSGALPSPPTISLGADNEVAATKTFNISSLTPCAYNLWLDVSYDLTGGYGRIDDDHDYIGFCVGEGNGSD
ncbi:hypothetical protein BRC93_08865 [Halobacteriales archaeon QS_5_70_15]|nr:MAG: hypothetical protein BRC93_08865 [Halobacteriales archaeon QS_5_70_15]